MAATGIDRTKDPLSPQMHWAAAFATWTNPIAKYSFADHLAEAMQIAAEQARHREGDRLEDSWR
jgi:hypothetical protein